MIERKEETSLELKTKLKRLIRVNGLKGSIQVNIGRDYGSIDISDSMVRVDGNTLLCVECYRLLKKDNSFTINRVNATNYIRTELKKIGKFRSSKKQKRS